MSTIGGSGYEAVLAAGFVGQTLAGTMTNSWGDGPSGVDGGGDGDGWGGYTDSGDGASVEDEHGDGVGVGFADYNTPTVAAYDSPDNMPALLLVMQFLQGEGT